MAGPSSRMTGRPSASNRDRGSSLPQRSRLSATVDPSSIPAPFNLPGSLPSSSLSARNVGGEMVSSHAHSNTFGFRSPPRALPFPSAGPTPLRQPAPGLSHNGNGLRWIADESAQGEPALEWLMNGLDVPLQKIRHLLVDEQQDASDLSNGAADNATTARPFSSLGGTTSQVAAYSWGGDPARWNLEIVRNSETPRYTTVGPAPPSESVHDPLLAPSPSSALRSGGLSIYLTCHSLDRDFPSSDVTIPVNIMLGIRDKRAQHSSTNRWLWRIWKEFEFGAESDYWLCHDMPEPMAMITQRNDATAIEHLVMTIQISSPTGRSGPHFREGQVVPNALLAGLETLFDDPGTGDVLVTVAESLMPPSSPSHSADLSSLTDTQSPLYRRRVIYAHSAILRARGGFFDAMLGSDHWAEGGETVSGRRRHRLSITDFSFETVWWLLKWVYTNEIRFAAQEDARKTLNDDLPEGLLGSGASAIGWNWQPLPAAASVRRGIGSDGDPSTRTVFGRVSPVSSTGRASPVQVRGPTSKTSSRISSRTGKMPAMTSVEDDAQLPNSPPAAKSVAPADPHSHPAIEPLPPSALNVYRLAHRCELTALAALALEHIVSSLTPRTAFPLLLATELWPELHHAVQQYTLDQWPTIFATAKDELQRCYLEVADGVWCNGGQTIFEFTELLTLNRGGGRAV